ncbi:MAG: hypothetical protein ACK4QW_07475 [Alphaproteobacteria bacterium]
MTGGERDDGGAADHREIVAFEHPFFAAVGEGHFRISEHTHAPAFMIRFGEGDAALSFSGIRRELHLADGSPDAAMLEAVAAGLRFVSVLRIGDRLPTEVLSGEASWEIEPRHHERALGRLTVQLVTWSSGDEAAITDADALTQIADDPAMLAKAERATGAAAARLAMADEEVKSTLRMLAAELAYIEALREKFVGVLAMQDKIDLLRRRFASERSVLEIADAVRRLMTVAVKRLRHQFEQIDAQTGEVVGMLKNPRAQEAYIRAKRDDLYCRMVAWREQLDRWERCDGKPSDTNVALLRETYRFLAPRFMPAQKWVLAGQLQRSVATTGRREIPNSMTW